MDDKITIFHTKVVKDIYFKSRVGGCTVFVWQRFKDSIRIQTGQNIWIRLSKSVFRGTSFYVIVATGETKTSSLKKKNNFMRYVLYMCGWSHPGSFVRMFLKGLYDLRI